MTLMDRLRALDEQRAHLAQRPRQWWNRQAGWTRWVVFAALAALLVALPIINPPIITTPDSDFPTVLYSVGVWGIPLAVSIANLVAAALLFVLLRPRVDVAARPLAWSIVRIAGASAALAGGAYGTWWLLDTVLGTLRRQASQMAVVFDEHGGTSGIITLEDLFDEVTGEIQDEPAEPQSIVRDASGRFRVAGTVRISQVGEALGCVLEHPDVDSVSGLVLTLLGHPPVVGDVVEYDHVRFEVTAVHRRGVRECLVSAVPPPETES